MLRPAVDTLVEKTLTKFSRPLHILALLLTLAPLQPLTAQSEDNTTRLNRIATSEDIPSDWEWAVRQISNDTNRNLVQASILSRKEYPRAPLVKLLDHPQLAVRLGALELLEQAAGNTFNFNPWEKPISDPNQSPALKQWQQWAGLKGEIKPLDSLLTQEQITGYIRDLNSGNADRKQRAIRMLEPHGMKAVTLLQTFLTKHPELPRNHLLNLKEAQYHLVLHKSAGENASILARDLTRGNRDQQLASINTLKKVGLLALPIVRDFIDAPDALVRETAIETILSLGGKQAIPLVIPILKKEKDNNVIHAAMRRFREIGGQDIVDLCMTYLDHDSEDMVVSALNTLSKLTKGRSDSRYSSSRDSATRITASEAQTNKVLSKLKDPRWRVRVSALEYVTSLRVSTAKTYLLDLLTDEDEFVRAHAIKAVVALRMTSAREKMEDMFLNDDDMIMPVTKALTNMSIPLPNNLIAHLNTREPDIIVGALRALDKDKKPFLEIIARFVTHDNLDISCAALRALANDSDKLKFDFVTNHITDALRSGKDEKLSSILHSLSLPNSGHSSYSSYGQIALEPTEPTTLDPLYDAFIRPGKKKNTAPKPVVLKPTREATSTGGIATLKESLHDIAKDWEKHPEFSYRAAFILGRANEAAGFSILVKNFDLLSTSQRAAIADDFYSPSTADSVPLFSRLMKDKLPEIRSEAAENAIDEENNIPLVQAALNILDAEDSLIQPHEFYSYSFESTAGDGKTTRLFREWIRKTLTNEDADSAKKVLALIAVKSCYSTDLLEIVTPYLSSGNQWLRRAAWYALFKAQASYPVENVEKLTKDTSPLVRLALPMSFQGDTGAWIHHFTDAHSKPSRGYNYSSKRMRFPSELEAPLRKLAKNDPDPRVRFESWFALMINRKTIDLDAFISLISEQPPESKISYRIADFLEKNYRTLGSGMKPLLAYADIKRISSNKLGLILKKFSDNNNSSFTSFSSLAQVTETKGQPQQDENSPDPEELAKLRKNLKVVVFYKPGCKECERAEKHLEDFKSDFPLITIERRNIQAQDNTLINQALCDRFQSPGAGKTPSMFTQAGAAIAPNVQPNHIGELLQNTMEMEDNPTWADFDEEEIQVAREEVEKTFNNMTLAIVIGGGLLDGINPCAFATIIFFLSYLQVAKRTPKEILAVGVAFITAIFIAYFSVGLAFHAAIDKLADLDSFKSARTIMTWVFAAFALLVAVLSLRDGIRASRGNIGDMTLQLPAFLKNRIRSTIRKRARARNYVIAAFITGLVISILELACTGQVYAPIVYQIQQGRADAYLYLLIYNLAFILPLVIIFILAYKGMTSDALIRFQTKHTATVKYATAILFFILTLVILFGHKFLPH